MDVVAVHEAATRGRASTCATASGPFFLEFRTYRFRAHSMFDPELYRDKAEVEDWKTARPDPHLHGAAQGARACSREDEFLALDAAARAEVDAAVAFAEAGTWEPVEDLLQRRAYAGGRRVMSRTHHLPRGHARGAARGAAATTRASS